MMCLWISIVWRLFCFLSLFWKPPSITKYTSSFDSPPQAQLATENMFNPSQHGPGVYPPLRDEHTVALSVAITGPYIIARRGAGYSWANEILPDTNYAGRKAGWYHEGSGAGDSVLRKGEGGLKMIGIGTEGERRMKGKEKRRG